MPWERDRENMAGQKRIYLAQFFMVTKGLI